MPPMPTVSHVAMSRTMVTSVVAPPAPAVRTLTLTASSSCYLQVTTNLSKWADYGVLKTNLTLTNNLPVALFRAIAKVPLAWDSSPDTNVAGYRIYAGQSSHSYTKAYDAGLTNSFVCPCWFATNYFAATAYDSAGIESDLSNEAVWTNQPVTLYIK